MKTKIMSACEAFFKALDKIMYVLAAIAVTGMLGCVSLQVLARHTALSFNWTTELSQYCFLWSTCFASYIAARRGKLIGVELVQKKSPAIVQRIMKMLSWAAATYFYSLVIYYGIKQLPKLMKQLTPMMKWPMGLIYIIMMSALAVLVLYSLYLTVKNLVCADDKKAPVKKTAEQIAEELE